MNNHFRVHTSVRDCVKEGINISRNEPGVPLNKLYILNNCNNAIIYDFTPAYLKAPLQIRVPNLHKAMSPNVTGDTVINHLGISLMMSSQVRLWNISHMFCAEYK
jgi:hypothetical protein